jgi:ubiquinone/menaquinone biosynthesis C-methylase UbiE
MERLNLNSKPTNPEIEAAIHCARYALAKNIVTGKKVLDVACGEGYGSFLLKQSGAIEVVGVDIDSEVIQSCQKNFGADRVRFIAGSAEELPDLLGDEKFDVVVCIETIEHVTNVNLLLEGIKYVLKEGGIIILTCPNDHWYYADSEANNVYHQRRYTFEEFQQVSSNILGTGADWSIGTACLGFTTTPTIADKQYNQIPNTWFSQIDSCNTYLVATNDGLSASPTSCSFFVGIWGGERAIFGSAVFAMSMDSYVDVVRAKNGDLASLRNAYADIVQARNNDLVNLKASLDKTNHIEDQLRSVEAEQRISGLRLSALVSENSLLRESLHAAREESKSLYVKMVEFQIGFLKYKKIMKFIPKIARKRFSRLLDN